MSILCVARWRSARSMIEWMCAQERWNPEVAIIFGAAARYRRATAGSSHDDAHPDSSTLHTGSGSPPLRLCGEPLLHIAPCGPWQFAGVRNAASFFAHFVRVRFLVGGDASTFFSGPAEAVRRHSRPVSTGWLFCNLMADPLLGEEDSTSPHAGFEPQRASSFKKRVEAPKILVESARA